VIIFPVVVQHDGDVVFDGARSNVGWNLEVNSASCIHVHRP
jgi:hypothetical protein